MKKIFFILISTLFILNTLCCFAQNNERKIVDIIGKWRNDMSCEMELNQLIRTKRDSAVDILRECCKKHSSACLPVYSGPDNKTLLYTAIETKSYKVAEFLFNYSTNYLSSVDDYGETIDTEKVKNNAIVKFAEQNSSSKTPLMLACSKCDYNGTSFLIKYNASLIKRNKLGSNAYQYAKENCSKYENFISYVKKEYDKQLDFFYKQGSLDIEEQERINKFNEIKEMFKRITMETPRADIENNFWNNLL